MGVVTKVTLEGNFFTRNPGKTFRQNVRDMLDQLKDWMDREVTAGIQSHAGDMPHYTGWSARHVEGFTSWNGRWGTWAAVQSVTRGMSSADAIRTKAAAASIERRWHPYRNVKSGVYRSRPIITANLTKNLE